MKLNVGDVVALNMPMLGCNIGTRGVVYETYQDFDEADMQLDSLSEIPPEELFMKIEKTF